MVALDGDASCDPEITTGLDRIYAHPAQTATDIELAAGADFLGVLLIWVGG